MKTKKLLLSFSFLLTMLFTANAQTWDFKTGVEGWGAYGGDIAPSWDNSDNLVCNYQITGNYPTIYNDQPLNVANANYFYMKFTATNWPKASVLVNITFEMGGNSYYANQTMNVASGEFQFNIRTEVQHTWSVLPATGTTSRIRLEIPHNSELAGSDWSTASLKIDKIAFTSSLTTGVEALPDNNLTIYPNPTTESFRISGRVDGDVSIFDATGRVIKRVSNATQAISVSDFNKGLYLVKFKSAGIKKVQRLQVK